MSEKTAVVVGDVVIDRYFPCTAERVSPEAPVPVLRSCGPTITSPGGAANVATNLAAQGVRTGLVYAARETNPDSPRLDVDRARMEQILTDAGVWHSREDSARTVPVKFRFTVDGRLAARVDDGDGDMSPETHRQQRSAHAAVVARVEALLPAAGVLVLSDYDKGLMADTLTRELVRMATDAGVPVVVAPRGDWASKYRGAAALVANRREAGAYEPDLYALLGGLAGRALRVGHVVVTAGAGPVAWRDWSASGDPRTIPVEARPVADVTGAGDTFLAVLAAGVLRGLPMADALARAVAGAGVAVSRPGTAVVTRADVDAAMGVAVPGGASKVVGYPAAREAAAAAQAAGRRVGFLAGEFRGLTAGHLRFLKRARRECDLLAVGVLEDAAGGGPSLADRMELLAELPAVDLVVAVPAGGSAETAVRDVRPDVLFVTEAGTGGRAADAVADRGGVVVTLPRL